MDKRFENVVPQAPASFDYAVERALHETEVEAMNKRKFSISLVWIMVALIVLAGAAVAVGGYFGITDFLSIDRRDVDGELPEVPTEYVGAQFTAGGLDITLVEYNYEGDRISLLFAIDGYTDRIMFPDVIGFIVDGHDGYSASGSSYGDGELNVSYDLEEIILTEGRDTETVRIFDGETGEELFAFEAVRTAGEELPEGEAVILDDTIENAGITIVGYDVERTSLTTELNVYYDIDPEAIVPDGFATEFGASCYRKGDVWHTETCELIVDDIEIIPLTHMEAMINGLTPCECAVEWMAGMEAPESIDAESLTIWVADEKGQRIPFGWSNGLADPDNIDPLKQRLSVEIDNIMIDSLPDVLHLYAGANMHSFFFNDAALIDVSALKAE